MSGAARRMKLTIGSKCLLTISSTTAISSLRWMSSILLAPAQETHTHMNTVRCCRGQDVKGTYACCWGPKGGWGQVAESTLLHCEPLLRPLPLLLLLQGAGCAHDRLFARLPANAAPCVAVVTAASVPAKITTCHAVHPWTTRALHQPACCCCCY